LSISRRMSGNIVSFKSFLSIATGISPMLFFETCKYLAYSGIWCSQFCINLQLKPFPYHVMWWLVR
jgi:hypothetical protein